MVKITAIYVFSHPDYTVGSGITPDRASAPMALSARGLYRRLGIMHPVPAGAFTLPQRLISIYSLIRFFLPVNHTGCHALRHRPANPAGTVRLHMQALDRSFHIFRTVYIRAGHQHIRPGPNCLPCRFRINTAVYLNVGFQSGKIHHAA